jgi:folate-binding protein YgfZ
MAATVPSHRATLEEHYRALHTAAVLGEIGQRGQLAVSGRDRATFLQGLLTNDIQALTPGSGCYAAWLTAQGRMLTDMDVLESGDMILLDLPAAETEPTLQRLDQFLFSEDVQLADLRSSLQRVSIHGPIAATLLERVLSGVEDVGSWPEYRNVRATFRDVSVAVARIDQLGVPGYAVYIAAADAERLRNVLREMGALEADPGALEAGRIEAAIPLFNVDMNVETIPLEAGIESRAISFSKGCYVGQEIIIRVLHRGHGRVARRLVTIRVDGEPPVAGARILAADKPVGAVTSSALSPRFGAIALGYVHRDFVAPGTAVEIESGEARVKAAVSEPLLTSAA